MSLTHANSRQWNIILLHSIIIPPSSHYFYMWRTYSGVSDFVSSVLLLYYILWLRLVNQKLIKVIESFSFKRRMLHDTGMIHSRYIHDAF